jgi:hypothetical protein
MPGSRYRAMRDDSPHFLTATINNFICDVRLCALWGPPGRVSLCWSETRFRPSWS